MMFHLTPHKIYFNFFRGVSSLVSRHHDHLLNLELDGAEVTDAAIRNISTCKKLQSLEMPFCEYLSDDSLLFLKVSPIEDLLSIATDKKGYPHNIFLISQQKHILWVLIRSASLRHF